MSQVNGQVYQSQFVPAQYVSQPQQLVQGTMSYVQPTQYQNQVQYVQPANQYVQPQQLRSVVPQQIGEQPQVTSYIEHIPIEKTYIDYEPVTVQQQVPYERQYVEYVPQTRTEYVPVTKTVIEYETVNTIQYQPVEKFYTDYQQVEHITEYVPQYRNETRIEYVPTERVEQYFFYQRFCDYYPTQRSQIVAHTTVQAPQVQVPPKDQIYSYGGQPLVHSYIQNQGQIQQQVLYQQVPQNQQNVNDNNQEQQVNQSGNIQKTNEEQIKK